jgi:sulfate adenylyltransferase
MLTKLDEINLINASNALDDFLDKNYVRSETEFDKFDIKNFGLPLLVAADPKIFSFHPKDIFKISKEKILNKIYNLRDLRYSGFVHAFCKNELFLSNFKVRDAYKDYLDMVTAHNSQAKHDISLLLSRHSRVGAFQTRNIPHAGHEKIIERMLENCDHLVINPVIGPKKTGDVTLNALRRSYRYLAKHKYNDRVSFIPISANMYYAGPNEAIHHTILRGRLGFSLFSVGRDHAGADGVYEAHEASDLVSCNQDKFKIKIITHGGAVYCQNCRDILLIGGCNCNDEDIVDISGTQFRDAIQNGKMYEFADANLQAYLTKTNTKIFQK